MHSLLGEDSRQPVLPAVGEAGAQTGLGHRTRPAAKSDRYIRRQTDRQQPPAVGSYASFVR